MDLVIVKGSVVSVVKIDEIKPVKLFLVQLLGKDYIPKNEFVVAIDCVGVWFKNTAAN